MRISVVLDDDLVKCALNASGLRTKKEAVEEGLKLLVAMHGQKKIKASRGTLNWLLDLDKMRQDNRSTRRP